MADALKLVKVFWPIFKLLLTNFAVLGVVGFIGFWVIFPKIKPFISHWQISPKIGTYIWGGVLTVLTVLIVLGIVGSIYILANVK